MTTNNVEKCWLSLTLRAKLHTKVVGESRFAGDYYGEFKLSGRNGSGRNKRYWI